MKSLITLLLVVALFLISILSSPAAQASKPVRGVTAPSGPVGPQSTLVILINFLDNTTQPMTTQGMDSLVFSGRPSVNDFYSKVSYGKISLVGDVVGWFTVPYNETSVCSPVSIAGVARAAASASGIDLTKYNRFIYMWPGVNPSDASVKCYIGMGTLGSTNGGTYSETWLWMGPGIATSPDDKAYTISSLAHEFGHNLGMGHANGFKCSTNRAIDAAANCASSEYGDAGGDAMGGNSNALPRELNAPHREAMGWIGASQIINVASSGTYVISPLENADSNIKILKIKKPDTNQYYYFSYRIATGLYDGQETTGSLPANIQPIVSANGTSIHIGFGNLGSTQALFSLPWSFQPSALTDGMRFEDGINGIQVTQISHDNNGVTLSIQLGAIPCQEHTPLLINASANSFTLGNPGYPSMMESFVLYNMNSLGCAPAVINIGQALLAGWSSTFPNQASVAGQTYTQLKGQVQSPSLASVGLYPYSLSATLSQNAAMPSASAGGTIRLVTGADVTAPTAPTGLVATIQNGNSVLLSWNPSTDNVAVDHYYIMRGYYSIPVTTTSTSVLDSTVDLKLSNTYFVYAVDAAGNFSYVAASVTVNPPPPPPSEVVSIAITSPVEGTTISRSVSVTVSVSSSVVGVELYADGGKVSTSVSAPFTTGWTLPKGLRRGSHTLQCRAYDKFGNFVLSQVVTVYK